jgi:DNA-binding response OmpR family regulator
MYRYLESPAAPFRILCVGESLMTTETLKLGFESYGGFKVVTATPGTDAMMQFHGRGGNFDAILIDHDAPVRNGLVLVKSVRASDFHGRILVMADRLSLTDFRAYQDCRVCGFFSKPFEINVVAAMLFHAISENGNLPLATPSLEHIVMESSSSE